MLPRRTKTPPRLPKTGARPSKTIPQAKRVQQPTTNNQQPTTNNHHHHHHHHQQQQQPDRPKTFDNYTNHIIQSKSVMTTRTGHSSKQKQKQARSAHQRHTVRWTQKTCTTILFHHVVINDRAPRFKNSTNDTSLSKLMVATHNNYFSKRCNYMIPWV